MIYRLLFLMLFIPSIAFGASQNYAVTSAGAGDGSGQDASDDFDWQNAMSYAQFETYIEDAPTAGDTFYFMGGETYILTSDLGSAAIDGTSTAPYLFIGVASGTTAEPPTPSDWAVGTDRPLFYTNTGYVITFGDYCTVKNIKISVDDTFYALTFGNYSEITNSDILNNNAAGEGVYSGTYNQIINNKITAGTIGLRLTSGAALFNYIHDTDTSCIELAGTGALVGFNILDTCTVGINVNSRYGPIILNNTIYGNTTGISGTTGHQATILNNSITDSTTGISWTNEYKNHHIDYNNYSDNTADVNANGYIVKGPNATAANPAYTNAAGGDFSLGAGSALRNAAQTITVGVD